MLAKDCMLPTTEVVHLDQSLIDAANRLRLFSLPVLPVVDGDEIVGLLTFEAVEARQRLSPEDLAETAVRDHMSAEVAFCRTDESMETVRAIMREGRSEEHTSELQSLMRISYAVFCLKKKKKKNRRNSHIYTHQHNPQDTHSTQSH